MDFSDVRRIKSNSMIHQMDGNQIFQGFSKHRSQGNLTEGSNKQVVVIYASGSMAANKQLQIERGSLQKILFHNFYLCDIEHTRKYYPQLDTLITPIQETGVRIQYKVVELKKIDSSINMELDQIGQIAKIIMQNYKDYHAFIVVTGLDTICHVGTVLSFMLENLSKLVICTGGYLPLDRMRNDSVSNLLECFSLVSQASTLNQVLIVLKNRGFRANRCIKMKQGDFQNIASPNLPAICSIKTKIQVRSFLIQPKAQQQLSIFTQLSRKVKILRLNQYQCIESLAYDLKNPFVKGMIIQSYSYANIPNLPDMLQLFKEAAEDPIRKIIFINISQAIHSKNDSLMRYCLESYKIYYGSDMTCEAALAKLAYLIGKGYPQEHIIKMMQVNLRGEMTQEKEKLQYKMSEVSVIQVVKDVLKQYFPSAIKDIYETKIKNNVSKYVIGKCTDNQFKQLFQLSDLDEKENQKQLITLSQEHKLLHRAVSEGNFYITSFLISIGVNINQIDIQSRSPQFYALRNRDKPMIQMLRKQGGQVVCPIVDLFQFFVQSLKKDDIELFDLLYHFQFKESLKNIKNSELRTVAHIAGLLNAQKCFLMIKQKFDISLNQPDIYGTTALQYMKEHSKNNQIH